jgi:hypothetical protein
VLLAFLPFTTLVACSSAPSDTENNGSRSLEKNAVPASPETTRAIGVTQWVPREEADKSFLLLGYDASKNPKVVFAFEAADGRVRVTGGDAILEFAPTPDGRVAIYRNTFPDHADVRAALDYAATDIQRNGTSLGSTALLTTSAVGPGALHTTDVQDPPWTPSPYLVGNQVQLVCTDAKNNPCQKPPSTGETVGTCAGSAAALAGIGCATTGLETVAIGCAVAALGGAAGAIWCAVKIDEDMKGIWTALGGAGTSSAAFPSSRSLPSPTMSPVPVWNCVGLVRMAHLGFEHVTRGSSSATVSV